MTGLAARISPCDRATRLRLAAAGDEPFLKQLFRSVRGDDFAAAGLPAEAVDRLIEQQFRAQAMGYAAQFPDAVSLIVIHRDDPVGRLLLLAADQRWHIVDIALIPDVRGRGIGTDLIAAIARAAFSAGARELSLSVLFSNASARRLYARLGFAVTADGVHVAMTKPLGE